MKFKKVVAGILTAAMVVTSLTVPVFANENINAYETEFANFDEEYFSEELDKDALSYGVEIFYELNGGINDVQNPKVYTGGTVKLLPAIRDGYKFKGWYNGKKKISKLKNMSEPITLQAVWTPLKYKIKYVLNTVDGVKAKNSNPKTYKTGEGFAMKSPISNGYKFLGWYTDEAFTTPFNGVVEGMFGDITVYAKWDENSVISNDKNVNEFLLVMNQERDKKGAQPLITDEKMMQAAKIRAKEIEKKFSHTRPDGTSCFTALDDVGYIYYGAGENIAYHTEVAKSGSYVFKMWKNSKGHYANMINPEFQYTGVACFKKNGICYWVQLFSY